MYRASAAAPPRSGVAPGGAAVGAVGGGAGTAAAPFPDRAAITSALVIRPPRAEPRIAPRSTPSSAATRRATGDAFAAPLPPSPAAAAKRAPFPSILVEELSPRSPSGPASRGAGATAAPEATVIRAIVWPTVTVSP